MTARKTIFFLILVIASFATSALADSDENTITGAWERTFSGGRPSLAIFHEDGTVVTRGSNSNVSNSLGVWEKVGPRSFAVKVRGFTFQEDGSLNLKFETRVAIELSQDGQSYTAEALTELRLPDGTLVATVPDSVTGERITLDDASDDD